jgi:hypothetical protein
MCLLVCVPLLLQSSRLLWLSLVSYSASLGKSYTGKLILKILCWWIIKVVRRNKRDRENNRNLKLFCFCSPGLHNEVCHLLFLFFLLLLLRDRFRYPNLRKLLKELEKMKELTRKLWGDIILGSLEERQVLVSKSIWFLYLILKKRSRRMICNKIKKRHYIKRSLPKSRF